jgi:hypothetical protein
MALPQIITEACDALNRLQDELQTLHLTIVEDRPTEECVLLVDQLGNCVEDLIGWCQEAIDNGQSARRVLDSAPDYLLASRAIGKMHERVNELNRRYHGDLASYERLSELVALGSEKRCKRPAEWEAWSQSVRESVEGCQHLFVEVDTCLLRCWCEIAEWVGVQARPLLTVSASAD